jgi:hypothetical protein
MPTLEREDRRGPNRNRLKNRAATSYNVAREDSAGFRPAGAASGTPMGVKKTGKGRRKLGQKKRRMRARIRHRKG